MNDEELPVVQHENDGDIKLLLQQDAHQYEYANHQLEANLQNQREIRKHLQVINNKNNTTFLIVSLSLLVLFFGFGFFALWLDKEEFLSDIMKVIVGAIGGGGLGFYFGARNKLPPQQ